MGRFRIVSHGRLQDWIAAEKGYFADEGLDYEFDVVLLQNADQSVTVGTGGVRTGAYELYRSKGRGKSDMSCACHWAVNQAAVDSYGRMWGHAYSVIPSAIYVHPGSAASGPGDLAGVEVAVGFHSGSHFSTIQALEAFLEPSAVKLGFIGMPYDRVDALLDGKVQAAAIWGSATYLVEQLGCRKVADSTFMAAFLFDGNIDRRDVERYFTALRRAQLDLDLEPERYKHHYLDEIPPRFHDRIDIRGFGPGERVVFLPYTQEMYERSQDWMRSHGLFEDAVGSIPEYETVVEV
ncbi:MAG: ABC transporter substrate-binding protein [Acidimicrobiales bacterium]